MCEISSGPERRLLVDLAHRDYQPPWVSNLTTNHQNHSCQASHAHHQDPSGGKRICRISTGSSVPPYNPHLHKLVHGKQTWAEPPGPQARAKGFLGWHQRGYLPHRDVPGLTQFVTFRLHDCVPACRHAEWEALLRIENDRHRRLQLEEYLDRGHGECWLRQPSIARVVEAALRYFDRQRYELLAWVIMPNHVHVLVKVSQTPLARLIQNWKGFSAREANKLLQREGHFWEREYWDTYMRDETQTSKARRYIEQNPVKAKLVGEAAGWRWSSARLRDANGRLV